MLVMIPRSEHGDSNPVAPLGYLAPLCVAIFFVFIWAIVGARHRYIRQSTGAHPLDPESLVSRGVISRGDVEKQFPLINYSAWWTSRNQHDAELKEIGTRTSTVSDRSRDEHVDDGDENKNQAADHNRVSATTTDTSGHGLTSSSSGTPGGLYGQEEPRDTASPDTEDADCLCAICMEGFAEGDMIRPLTCGHIFHPFCVDPWLTRRQACCPLCKKTFSHHRTSAEEHRIRTSFSALLPAPPGAVLLRNEIVPRNP